MAFRTTWLFTLAAVSLLAVASLLEWLSPAVGISVTGVLLVLLIGNSSWRSRVLRKRDRAQQRADIEDVKKAIATNNTDLEKSQDRADELRGELTKVRNELATQEEEVQRQATQVRTLQDARLEAQLQARRQPSLTRPANDSTPEPGERVLVWRGPAQHDVNLDLDLLISSELTAIGAHTSIVLCDGASGCLQRRDDAKKEVRDRGTTEDWAARCASCFSDSGLDEVRATGIPYFTFNGAVDQPTRDQFRAWADEKTQEQMVDFVHRGIKVGHWAASSAIRYFFGADPMTHPRFLPMLREYFYTSLLSAEAAWSIFEKFQPTRIVMQHGIYVEWGPAFELAGQRKIPLTRWTRGYLYRGHHWLVKTCDPTDRRHPHHSPEQRWRKLSRRSLTATERQRLQRYMEAQALKQNNRYVLHKRTPETAEAVRARLAIPDDKPVFAVFCHLSWDAQYGFEEATDGSTFRRWLEDTVATAIETDDVHWLIKVHPAERVNKQAVGCQDFIEQRFGELPGHVQVLAADVDVNTYDLFPLLDGVATIFGTAGLEAAMLGKKVILAGHAHYGSKGFTADSPTRSDYVQNLSNAASMPAPSPVQREIARRYAYDYFVARQLPFAATVAYRERKQGKLEPRRARMLRKWAETILNGSAFAMDDQEVELYAEFPEVSPELAAGHDWAGVNGSTPANYGDEVATADGADDEMPRPLTGVFG